MTIEASFDEFSLDIAVRYQGEIPQSDTPRIDRSALMLAEPSFASIASVLLHRLADRVRMKRSGTSCEIELHFEH